jgi:WD40 repeat protein
MKRKATSRLIFSGSALAASTLLLCCFALFWPRFTIFAVNLCEQAAIRHPGEVWAVAFSPDSETLVSGDHYGTIRTWNVANCGLREVLKGHSSGIARVCFDATGEVLASGSWNGTVTLWNFRTGNATATFDCAGKRPFESAFAFAAHGNVFALVVNDNSIRLWDYQRGVWVGSLSGQDDGIGIVAFSHDGRMLASGAGDQTIRVWDVGTGQCVRVLDNKHVSLGYACSLAFSPTDEVLAAGERNGSIRLWDVATGEVYGVVDDDDGEVPLVAYSPNGDILATASIEDDVIKVWSAATLRHLANLRGHTGGICSIAFAPNGKLLASASLDGTVRLWDTARWGEIRRVWDRRRRR